MKIILISDVKNKGKKGQIVDVPDGFANFLIQQKQALMASEANLKKIEDEKKAKIEAEKQAKIDAQNLKMQIQDKVLIFKVKVGENGRLFGTISTKQIVEEFEKQFGIKLDKRKFLIDETINSLGYTKVSVQIHHEVVADFQVLVTNK